MIRGYSMFLNLLIKGLTKPYKIVKIVRDIRKVGINPFVLSVYLMEILLDRKFWLHIDGSIRKVKQSFKDPRLGGWMLDFPSLFLYSIVRITKPDVVIETGVGPGGSSAIILNALNKNKKGHLYSIDLPGYDSVIYPKIGRHFNIHVPPGYEVGWLVPLWLRNRWTLILGDSKEKLPELLNNISSVDIFLHDSLHTDEHITFELTTVLPKMSEKGLLLADDVNDYWSLAFINFCIDHSFPYTVIGKRLGIAKASREEH